MEKILISWYAYNNDFVIQQLGKAKRNVGMVNEDGPTFNVHRYFYDGVGYSKHILLNNSLEERDKRNFQLLVAELKKEFKKHTIEPRDIPLEDPINIAEIFTKLNSFLAGLTDKLLDIFISPGTPAMQTAWYLLGTNYKTNISLFQVRGKEFTKDKNRPDQIWVSVDKSFLPTNITVAEKLSGKPVVAKDILITESLEPIYRRANQIAVTYDISCLILGENGTGKENLAKYIHDNSLRKNKPYLTVNCAIYTDELLRSELFGHEKGSFTGAAERKIGLFEAANGGTIFLDEIGDISQKMQLSLLRVLQEKKIQRIGSVKEIDVDVRVIAATNQDLEDLCEKNKFRWDLFFRLAVITLKLPSLREWKREDLRKLISHFNKRFSVKFPNRSSELKITKQVMIYLMSYTYRGNVRELENLFIHFYTFCQNEINLEDLPDRMAKKTSLQTLAEIERQHIIKLFKLNNMNILATSKILDIHRDTLKRKLAEYGFDKKLVS